MTGKEGGLGGKLFRSRRDREMNLKARRRKKREREEQRT